VITAAMVDIGCLGPHGSCLHSMFFGSLVHNVLRNTDRWGQTCLSLRWSRYQRDDIPPFDGYSNQPWLHSRLTATDRL